MISLWLRLLNAMDGQNQTASQLLRSGWLDGLSVIHNQLDRKVVKSESSPTIFMGIYYGFTAILILFKGIYWTTDYSQLLQ